MIRKYLKRDIELELLVFALKLLEFLTMVLLLLLQMSVEAVVILNKPLDFYSKCCVFGTGCFRLKVQVRLRNSAKSHN